MKLVINDIPFGIGYSDEYLAFDGIVEFINNCKKLQSEQITNADGIYSVKIEGCTEIAPGCNLLQLLAKFKSKDQLRYLLSLLLNSNQPNDIGKEVFLIDKYESKICAWAQDGILISLRTNELFENDMVSGAICGCVKTRRNISREEHINTYRSELGIRIYEKNEKHSEKEYRLSKNRSVSIMDLNNEEAQSLLNQAIHIDGKLYAKKNGKYYSFQNHSDNNFHGYKNDSLELKIRSRLDCEKWK